MTTTATTERCINLRAWEVRAYREGRLTQLWRPIPRPDGLSDRAKACRKGTAYPDLFAWVDGDGDDIETWGVVGMPFRCPYGQPGGVLLGREAIDARWDCDSEYVADEVRLVDALPQGWDIWHVENRRLPVRRLSAAQMPKWACRNRIPLLGVRVRRLGEMTEADAEAMGFDGNCGVGSIPAYERSPKAYHAAVQWEADHGKGSWDADVWCWVMDVEAPK